MRNSKTNKELVGPILPVIKAIASPVRLSILELLKSPTEHFPAQVDGDILIDGVCADHIRDKIEIAAATASRHLTLLTQAGLLTATRKKGWTFYRRNERSIQQFILQMKKDL